MADELRKVREGFGAALEDLDGVRVYRYAPAGMPNDLPAITLDRIDVEYQQVVGDGKIRGTLRATLLVQHVDAEEGRAMLESFMDVAGSNSIYEVIDADRTLDGNVSVCWLEGFTEANLRQIVEVPVQATVVTFGFMT